MAGDTTADEGTAETPSRSETKYGDEIEGHDWSAPDREPEPTPEANVSRHTLVVLDERPDQQDIKYQFAIADSDIEGTNAGEIFAVDRAHRLAESNQFDPMGYVAWGDIPNRVKDAAKEALGESLQERVDVGRVNEMVRGWDDD